VKGSPVRVTGAGEWNVRLSTSGVRRYLTAGLLLACTAGVLVGGSVQTDAVLQDTQPVASDVRTATLAPPANVQTASTTTQHTITWTASTSPFASGYQVYRASAAAGPYTLLATIPSATTTSYIDTAIPPTAVYYRIRTTAYSWSSTDTVEASAAPPYTPTIQTDDPYLWWRMDEKAGTTAALDSSGYNRPGTYSGMTLGQTSALANKYGTSAYTNNNKVTANTNPAITNNFAIEVWVNPTRSQEVDPVNINRGVGYEQNMYAGVNNVTANGYTSGSENYIWDPDDRYASLSSYTYSKAVMGVAVGTNGVQVYEHTYDWMPCVASWTGTLTGWHYVVVNVVNRVPAIYIDGVLVTTGVTAPITTIYSPYILGKQDQGYGYFTGGLDEVALYNHSLTAQQIMTHYVSGHNP
jgi:hypothetical protein